MDLEFQSTLSLRRATLCRCNLTSGRRGFQSTLSLRRATLHIIAFRREKHISIHALLAESDCSDWIKYSYEVISIHALLAESDHHLRFHLLLL